VGRVTLFWKVRFHSDGGLCPSPFFVCRNIHRYITSRLSLSALETAIEVIAFHCYKNRIALTFRLKSGLASYIQGLPEQLPRLSAATMSSITVWMAGRVLVPGATKE